MISKIHKGYSKNGKPIFDNRELFMKEFAKDRKFEIVVKDKQKSMSREQQKYYWKVIVYLASLYLGEPFKRAHRLLKEEFLLPNSKGEYTTRDKSTKEIEKYHSDIRIYFAVDGCDIPEPEKISIK